MVRIEFLKDGNPVRDDLLCLSARIIYNQLCVQRTAEDDQDETIAVLRPGGLWELEDSACTDILIYKET